MLAALGGGDMKHCKQCSVLQRLRAGTNARDIGEPTGFVQVTKAAAKLKEPKGGKQRSGRVKKLHATLDLVLHSLSQCNVPRFLADFVLQSMGEGDRLELFDLLGVAGEVAKPSAENKAAQRHGKAALSPAFKPRVRPLQCRGVNGGATPVRYCIGDLAAAHAVNAASEDDLWVDAFTNRPPVLDAPRVPKLVEVSEPVGTLAAENPQAMACVLQSILLAHQKASDHNKRLYVSLLSPPFKRNQLEAAGFSLTSNSFSRARRFGCIYHPGAIPPPRMAPVRQTKARDAVKVMEFVYGQTAPAANRTRIVRHMSCELEHTSTLVAAQAMQSTYDALWKKFKANRTMPKISKSAFYGIVRSMRKRGCLIRATRNTDICSICESGRASVKRLASMQPDAAELEEVRNVVREAAEYERLVDQADDADEKHGEQATNDNNNDTEELALEKLRVLTYVHHVRMYVHQRRAFQRSWRLEDGSDATFVLDFKESVRLPVVHKFDSTAYHESFGQTCLGAVAAYRGADGERKERSYLLFSEDCKHDGWMGKTMLGAVLWRFEQEQNQALENADWCRVVSIWFDTGSHFRNGEMLAYVLRQLNMWWPNVEFRLHFFAEQHGKNPCDERFSLLGGYIAMLESRKDTNITSTPMLVEQFQSLMVAEEKDDQYFVCELDPNLKRSRKIAALFKGISDLHCFAVQPFGQNSVDGKVVEVDKKLLSKHADAKRMSFVASVQSPLPEETNATFPAAVFAKHDVPIEVSRDNREALIRRYKGGPRQDAKDAVAPPPQFAPISGNQIRKMQRQRVLMQLLRGFPGGDTARCNAEENLRLRRQNSYDSFQRDHNAEAEEHRQKERRSRSALVGLWSS